MSNAWMLFFCVLLLEKACSLDTEVVVLRAVLGQEARLPCGQGKVFLDGPDSYVLWLKNDRDLLYRFPNDDSERTLDRVYSSNCNGDTCHDDTALSLNRVGEEDGGIYRCRVHYQALPSVDYVIDLRLVDSPGNPRIYNEDGVEITRGYIGPLSIGADLTLVCEVDDGDASSHQSDTLVYWRRNGVVIERAHAVRPGVLRAGVRVHNVTRGELDAHYECLAQNADVTDPLGASVVVKMYLPPLSVEIRLNNNPDFEAGQPRVVDCVVVGCVPPPSITWHLGDTLLRSTVHKKPNTRKETIQENSAAFVKDDFKKSIDSPPKVATKRPMTTKDISGNTEQSGPSRPKKPNTTRDPIQKKSTATVNELHDGNYTVSSLTLAPSLRDSRQRLVCRAHNSHLPAHVFEDSVTLNVGYRPVCLVTREELVGVVTREAETVTCVVEASPEPMQVSWTFADTRTLYTSVKKVPGHLHRYSSTLTWLPRNGDLGLLLCRATNAFGEQKRACVYSITDGGPPRQPECGLIRAYGKAVKVICKKGWDGGRPQTVHLELYDSDGAFLQNLTDPAGHFVLSAVRDHMNFTVVVYVANSRGRSQPINMHVETAEPLTSAVSEVSHERGWVSWLGLVACVLVVVVVITAATFGYRIAKLKRLSLENNPDLVPRSDGTFHREPDFTQERVLGTTNITVNQLSSCPNQYSASPVPSCRVTVGCHSPPTEICPVATQQAYYV